MLDYLFKISDGTVGVATTDRMYNFIGLLMEQENDEVTSLRYKELPDDVEIYLDAKGNFGSKIGWITEGLDKSDEWDRVTAEAEQQWLRKTTLAAIEIGEIEPDYVFGSEEN